MGWTRYINLITLIFLSRTFFLHVLEILQCYRVLRRCHLGPLLCLSLLVFSEPSSCQPKVLPTGRRSPGSGTFRVSATGLAFERAPSSIFFGARHSDVTASLSILAAISSFATTFHIRSSPSHHFSPTVADPSDNPALTFPKTSRSRQSGQSKAFPVSST